MFMGLCARAKSGVGLHKGMVRKGSQQWEVLECPRQNDFVSKVVFCCTPSRAHKSSLKGFHYRGILE